NDHPFNNCSKYLIQPQLNNDNGQYTGKFEPKDRTFPYGGYPTFTVNIFDSVNKTIADEMYDESVKDTYFEKSTTFVTSAFRKNRAFLGHPTTRNDTYFMSAASGFQIDPNDFMVETQIEQRNKSALSVISNVLAITGALLTLDVFLFGFRTKKPWGFIRTYFLRNTIEESHQNLLQTQLENTTQLVEEINKLKDFLSTVFDTELCKYSDIKENFKEKFENVLDRQANKV
ncbi:14495_t:CDS:2, partial [Dentiscutata erythropus]